MTSSDDAKRLASLFKGFSGGYGTYDSKLLGKAEGKQKVPHYMVKTPPTVELFEAHLLGKTPLGIYLLDDNEQVNFGAIDIDEYPIDLPAIAVQLDKLSLPLIVCNSKSGGAHVYVFFETPQCPADTINVLKIIAEAIGYPGVEIFPKQPKRSSGGYGNYINIPFFGHPSLQYACFTSDGKLGLSGFLDLAESRQTNTDELKRLIGKMPASKLLNVAAPNDRTNKAPCGGQNIPEGQRNHTLFREGVTLANAGVSDAEVIAHIERRAADCDSPLPRSEIIGIQKSVTSYRETAVIPFTDLGNGERLVRDWDGQILYCSDQRAWYAWTDTHWEMDEQRVKQCAKKTTRNLRTEEMPSAEMLKAQIAWQKTSESTARQASMLEAASSDEKLTRKFDVFCRDERLFNLQNGTFDLDKLTLREHRRGDHITKIANASLTEDATCPRWIQFVDEITDGDKSLAMFLQKFCGYMLSGDRSEQIILFLLGEGANGKSVFLDVLKYVFGTYAGVINAKALTDRNANSIPSDIAALANKRFVMMSEFPEHAPLNTATVKSITGGDEITARHLYKEWFEFKPQFQVVCALNNLPKLTWVDEAYFRRVRIVPFNRIFEPHERDKSLHTALKAEADGIMRWIVEGYQLYLEKGLEPTPIMEAYLDEYRTNSDPIYQFVDSYIEEADENGFIPVQTMLDAIKDYCYRQGLDSPTEAFTRRRLRELLGATVQKRVGQHKRPTRGYIGYNLVADREDDYPF